MKYEWLRQSGEQRAQLSRFPDIQGSPDEDDDYDDGHARANRIEEVCSWL